MASTSACAGALVERSREPDPARQRRRARYPWRPDRTRPRRTSRDSRVLRQQQALRLLDHVGVRLVRQPGDARGSALRQAAQDHLGQARHLLAVQDVGRFRQRRRHSMAPRAAPRTPRCRAGSTARRSRARLSDTFGRCGCPRRARGSPLRRPRPAGSRRPAASMLA